MSASVKLQMPAKKNESNVQEKGQPKADKPLQITAEEVRQAERKDVRIGDVLKVGCFFQAPVVYTFP